ncbi:MAG: sugar transferase [Candidatus Amulumruptor caecigallinarius]|nr:sugar transferase [Candidatus Amulumruptor caecigallinarius]MCM1395913.1 sugar transferase [Candidatus Amulumruptor caecigallinarius]MCM1452948.1 sugar transferase [bacterium]
MITRQRLSCVCGDYLATVAAVTLYYVCHNLLLPEASGVSTGAYLCLPGVRAGILLFPLVMLGFYWLAGTYRTVFRQSRLSIFLRSLAASVAGSLGYFFLVLSNRTVQSLTYNHLLVAILAALLLACLWSERSVMRAWGLRCIRRGKVSFPTLIVGTDSDAVALLRRMEESGLSREFAVAGFISPSASMVSEDVKATGLPVWPLTEISRVAWEEGISRIIFIPTGLDEAERDRVMAPLYALNMPVMMRASATGTPVRRPFSDIKGEPLVDITHPVMTDCTACLKRALDVSASILGLIAAIPVIGITALAIKTDSPGPVFYRQTRLGYRGHPFTMFKLRSMHTDAEADGRPQLTSVGDPRVTRVGSVIRKYRIDELPQLWNVLRGDMSLVGPRPEREHYARRILEQAPAYYRVYQVRPGLTSWGMVRYGYVETVPEMVSRMKYDLIYLDNVTIANDLRIILHTVVTALSGRGR